MNAVAVSSQLCSWQLPSVLKALSHDTELCAGVVAGVGALRVGVRSHAWGSTDGWVGLESIITRSVQSTRSG